MEWLGDLLGGAASVASGGLFGLFGSVVGQVSKYFARKQEFAQKQVEWQHELKLQELQMQARAEETEQELAIAQQEGSWRGLESSHANRFAASSGWAKDAKAMVRPLLTFALWGVVIYVFVWVQRPEARDYLSPQQATEAVVYMIHSVMFAASTATVWWFGDRALSPPREKHA